VPYITGGAFSSKELAKKQAALLKAAGGNILPEQTNTKEGVLERVLVRYEEGSAQKVFQILESQGIKPLILMKEEGKDRFVNLSDYVREQSAKARPGSTWDPYVNLPYHRIMHAAVEASAAAHGKSAQARNIEGIMYGTLTTESRGKEQAVSLHGALGLMQVFDLEDVLSFFPEKKREYKAQKTTYDRAKKEAIRTKKPLRMKAPKYPLLNPEEREAYRRARQYVFRPDANIRNGVERYFKCLDYLASNGVNAEVKELELGIAAYNAGPGYVVDKWKENSNEKTRYARAQRTIESSYRETRNHVRKVLTFANNYRNQPRNTLD
jgi:hypothetical protein